MRITIKNIPILILITWSLLVPLKSPAEYRKLAQPEFIGIYINDLDMGTNIAFAKKDNWFFPIELLEQALNIDIAQNADELVMTTPVGEFIFNKTQFFIDGTDTFISLSALKTIAKFEAEFNQQNYAIVAYPPWGNNSVTSDNIPDPDITPAPTRLSQVSIESNLEQLAGEIRQRHKLMTRGAAVNGLWHLQYQKPDLGEDFLDEYYYVHGTQQQQTFIGFDNISPNSLINAAPFTGIQHVYSNQRISPKQQRRIDIDDFYNSIGGPKRQIRGVSEPGAIAILRVNGRNINETRVNLDGKFSFNDVRVNNNDFNDIEVVIVNRSRTAIIERIDFSIRPQATLLSKGQNLIYAALGQRGNITRENSTANQNNAIGSVLFRHGISDKITVEASSIDNAINQYQSLGITSNIGSHTDQSLQWSTDGNNQAYDINLNANGEKWYSRLQLRQVEQGFRNNIKDNHIYRSSFNYRLIETDSNRMDIKLIGSSRESDSRKDEYILPALDFYTQYNELSITPDSQGDYNIHATHQKNQWRARYDTNLREKEHALSLRYTHNQKLQSLYNFNFSDRPSQDIQEIGIQWLPEKRRYLDSDLSFSILSDRDFNSGYNIQFDNTIIPGIELSLYSRRQPIADDQLSSTFYGMDLRVNLNYRNRRLIPADISPNNNLNNGAIAGKILAPGNGEILKDLDTGTLKINGVNRDIKINNGNYYVDNVPVGVHRVQLGSKSLPIEMSPNPDESYWVQVSPGNISNVDLSIAIRLGFAGRVLWKNENMNAAKIEVYNNENDLVARSKTNQFGLYRIDNIQPGKYKVIATIDDCKGEKLTTLTTQHLFGQNINLSCD